MRKCGVPWAAAARRLFKRPQLCYLPLGVMNWTGCEKTQREDDAYHPLFFIMLAVLPVLQCYLGSDTLLGEYLKQDGVGDTTVNDMDLGTARV
jgi:hypothetical protein